MESLQIFTGTNALTTAVYSLLGAVIVSVYQNRQKRVTNDLQRFADAIGVEQKLIDAISARARIFIRLLESNRELCPSDYDIEKALFETVLDSSNVTFLSSELCSVGIQGRRWAKDVVHANRDKVLEICKSARDRRANFDAKASIQEIRVEASRAAKQTAELFRAVQDRKHFLNVLRLSRSRYYSVTCEEQSNGCLACRRGG